MSLSPLKPLIPEQHQIDVGYQYPLSSEEANRVLEEDDQVGALNAYLPDILKQYHNSVVSVIVEEQEFAESHESLDDLIVKIADHLNDEPELKKVIFGDAEVDAADQRKIIHMALSGYFVEEGVDYDENFDTDREDAAEDNSQVNYGPMLLNSDLALEVSTEKSDQKIRTFVNKIQKIFVVNAWILEDAGIHQFKRTSKNIEKKKEALENSMEEILEIVRGNADLNRYFACPDDDLALKAIHIALSEMDGGDLYQPKMIVHPDNCLTDEFLSAEEEGQLYKLDLRPFIQEHPELLAALRESAENPKKQSHAIEDLIDAILNTARLTLRRSNPKLRKMAQQLFSFGNRYQAVHIYLSQLEERNI